MFIKITCLLNNMKNISKIITIIMTNMGDQELKNIYNQANLKVYKEINKNKLALMFILIKREIKNILKMNSDKLK